jgi:hypothetical protein
MGNCVSVEEDKQPISQWPVFNPPPVPGSPVSVEPDQVNCTGHGLVRDPNNCAVYYLCEWGMKHTYICPEGLHYDPSLKLCNWPHIAGCEGISHISETSNKKEGILTWNNLEYNFPLMFFVVLYFQ